MLDDIKYPIRINRYLALRGLATRREADQLIKAGKVLINNRPAKLGDTVIASDQVALKTESQKLGSKSYLAYHKRAGETTKERYLQNLFPLGRLDKDSEGLMILTNDGRLTERLLNPDRDHEKEYLVTVDRALKQTSLNAMSKGLLIEGYRTKPAETEWLDEKQFRIVLTEGKKHQIRRMGAALGYQITRLKRIRIANIKLGDLAPGNSRPVIGRELGEFLTGLGLNPN